MAEPETAHGADAPAEILGEPRGSKLRPEWAHNPKGFVIHLDGETFHPFCQETMRVNEDGEPIACGKKPRYVRTLWNDGTVFSCGGHLNRMEDLAKPVVAMGSRGAAVLKPVLLDAPNYRWVPGAADPSSAPSTSKCCRDRNRKNPPPAGVARSPGRTSEDAPSGREENPPTNPGGKGSRPPRNIPRGSVEKQKAPQRGGKREELIGRP